MTDNAVVSEPADFAGVLASRERDGVAARERNLRRGIAGIVVLVLHVLALAVFIYSSRIPILERIRETIPEAIVWFTRPVQPAKPSLVRPILPQEALPEVSLPLSLAPIPARPLPAEPYEDGMRGVGRSLACGASSYENLSPGDRERCRRHPWHFVRKPDGTIILDIPKPVEPPPTTIDIMRHEQQTAPPCPLLSNVPCLGKIMHGDPLGNGPHPF